MPSLAAFIVEYEQAISAGSRHAATSLCYLLMA